MKKDENLVIMHESYLASVLNDITTLGFLLGMYVVNQEYLNNAVPDWVIGCVFVVWLSSKFSFAKSHILTNKQDAQEFIDNFYKD